MPFPDFEKPSILVRVSLGELESGFLSNTTTRRLWIDDKALRIQVCPKKGIHPTVLLWGWDWDHQTYSRVWYGSLGKDDHPYRVSYSPSVILTGFRRLIRWFIVENLCFSRIFLSPCFLHFTCCFDTTP